MRGGEERRGFATWGADAVPFVVGTKLHKIGIPHMYIGGIQEKRKQKANAHQAKEKGGNCETFGAANF